VFIPLTDPIWTRLYGPYGLEPVAQDLHLLNESWSAELAQNLLWEKLHHQDTLYPVTYAALPWLWDIAQRNSLARADILDFLSHVVTCAVQEPQDQHLRPLSGPFAGLPREPDADQAHSMRPEDWLRPEDAATLAALEAWFTQSAPGIAVACLTGISADDRDSAERLARGYLTLNGGSTLAETLKHWSGGESVADILRMYRLSAAEVPAARRTAAMLRPTSAALADFIEAFAAASE
jgi:hypothetical protein